MLVRAKNPLSQRREKSSNFLIIASILSHTLNINSVKKEVPFSGPCLSKIIHKNPNNFTYLHYKGFKHCFPCLFSEP
jgi:hypothetical protein